MRIGNHDIAPTPHGFVTALAPMAAITNPPFRTLAKEHGCGLTVTEMVSSDALVRGGPNGLGAAQLRMERAPIESFYVVQLFGGDPDIMAEAARIVEADGADVVDINMGCPVRKIAGKCNAGVSLMKEPERAASLVRAMTKAVKIPVTAKIRAGWDDQHINAPEVAKALEDAGAAMISVHARTKEMVHKGDPRLEILADVKKSVSVPVLGNGGVKSVAEARRMHNETGCDGVMIGRGAHGNPWVFRSMIEGRDYVATIAERFEAMARHFELYVMYGGDHRAAREMRKHLIWYLTGMPSAAQFRAELHRLMTAEAMREAIERYRDDVMTGRFAHMLADDARGDENRDADSLTA
jgi:tRNA-dihydrouridine synthase B